MKLADFNQSKTLTAIFSKTHFRHSPFGPENAKISRIDLEG